jgi:putative inorganic carbon (HCO3(-)) transporter
LILQQKKLFAFSFVAAIASGLIWWQLNKLAIPSLIVLSVLSAAIIFSIYNERILIFCMISSLPLSINLQLAGESSVIFPSEFLVGLLTLIFLLRTFYYGFASDDFSFIKHPLTLLIAFYFLSLVISCFFSEMPVVSLKSMLLRISYLLVFYFLMHNYFKSSGHAYRNVFLYYGFALSAVILFALYNLLGMGFTKNNAALSVHPFYNDHTIYSAAIAFMIPAFVALISYSRLFRINQLQKFILSLMLSFFLIGMYASFSRAAWISLLVALLVYILMIFKTRWITFNLFLVLIIGITALNYNQLIGYFSQNRIDSNVRNAGFYEQTGSITNISNDVSNAERLNRWSCAIRMFRDKPLTGFGIGTYQFEYLSYQRRDEMTRISVTKPYDAPPGRGGSAHSEYFVLLSESGIISLIAFIAICLYSFYLGLKLFYQSTDKKIKIIACIALLGLITYFTHGLFNNFLENDKLAFLFWASLSILSTLDLSQTLNRNPN